MCLEEAESIPYGQVVPNPSGNVPMFTKECCDRLIGVFGNTETGLLGEDGEVGEVAVGLWKVIKGGTDFHELGGR